MWWLVAGRGHGPGRDPQLSTAERAPPSRRTKQYNAPTVAIAGWRQSWRGRERAAALAIVNVVAMAVNVDADDETVGVHADVDCDLDNCDDG